MRILDFKFLAFLFGLYLSTMLAVFVLSSRVTVIFGIHTMGASVVYPLCIFIGDIIAEVYGYAIFRKIMWITFVCSFIFCFYLKFINFLPTDTHLLNINYTAIIDPILLMTTLIIVGATVGQFIDSYFLIKWKFLIGGRLFWLRCVSSTAIGAFITTFIAYLTRLYVLPFDQAIKLILVAYLLKLVGVAIFATPGTIIVYFLKKYEPKELLEIKKVNFNPFKIN